MTIKRARKSVIVKTKGRYRLTRERDGFGHPYAISISSVKKKAKTFSDTCGKIGEVRVGHSLLALSLQQWCLTTPVQEILEVLDDGYKVRFRTENSVYTVEGQSE